LKDVKIKIIFDNNAKISCINKSFANNINLVIRQDIFILLIEVTRARARFEEIVKNTKISIEKIIIYIFIFVVSRLNYEILLKQFF